MESEIIVVSGLPRSGTSLMMQMLEKGGIEIITDNQRTADTDNPRGYYELEKVKQIKRDSSWLPQARGKAIKMVSQLLYDLPSSETYRILFMERDLDEMLLSQEKMLHRLGRSAAPREDMKRAYTLHLERLHGWLRLQTHLRCLLVSYNALLERAQEQAERVHQFLGGLADIEKMVQTVDPSLYRNRNTGRSDSCR
jgi:Sulfotransferase domain